MGSFGVDSSFKSICVSLVSNYIPEGMNFLGHNITNRSHIIPHKTILFTCDIVLMQLTRHRKMIPNGHKIREKQVWLVYHQRLPKDRYITE